MSEVELEPCPFCGSGVELEVEVREDDAAAPRPHYHFVISCCATLSVESRHWWSGNANPPEDEDDQRARAEVVRVWNTRAAPPAKPLPPAAADLIARLLADELPGDRQAQREARIELGGLLNEAAEYIKLKETA